MADYYAFATHSVFGIVAHFFTVKKYVDGVSGARHKRFDNYEEAFSFLLTYVAAEEVYGAGFADDDCRYRIQYRTGYWGVRTVNGDGIFTSERRVLDKIPKEAILEVKHFQFWPEAYSFAYRCPRYSEKYVREYNLNTLYINPVSFQKQGKT